MQADEIKILFSDVRHVIVPDRNYQIPTLKWCTKTFPPFFQKELVRYGVEKWSKKHDCDNFAREYCVFAQICHARTEAGTAEGVAIGECFVAAREHAIVVAITEAGVVYLEPQITPAIFISCKILELTRKEIQSIWFVRF